MQARGQRPDHAGHLRVVGQLHRRPGAQLLAVTRRPALPTAAAAAALPPVPARCGVPAAAAIVRKARQPHTHNLVSVAAQVKDAEAKGATFCTGPYRREGNLIWPVVLDNVTPDMRIAWEEVRWGGRGVGRRLCMF
jgi:glyceraldehyde-3-phosphate dehydrogenase (NADP+)